MKVLSVIKAGAETGFPAVLTEYLNAIYPHAAIVHVPDEAAALAQSPCNGSQLLIAAADAGCSPATLAHATDQEGLPRWAVLRFGGEGGGIPLDHWTAATLSILLEQAVARHVLNRENLTLRGDLLTLARRVSHDLRTP